MPTDMVCTLNVGTNCIHDNARASMREAARHWGCNYLEITAPAKPGSHHYEEKCYLHKHLPREGRFLFLDGDIVIRSDCPNPFKIVPAGMLGWVRSHHPGHDGPSWHVSQCLPDYARRAGVDIDIETEYVHSGFMLFEFPQHLELFAECERVIAEVGFNPRWELADQGVFTVARKRLESSTFWLPAFFQMAGSSLWSGWTPEMKTFVYHFCGPINEHIAIPRTVWDDLGPDRHVTGSSVVRWRNGKPVHLTGGDEFYTFIRELAQIRGGKIVEVGCYLGGSAWYGAQIARDNYSEYHCIDHWGGASDLAVGEDHYRGFLENMADAGLQNNITVHRKPSVEAAADFAAESLALVFLDGDHSYAGCLADIDAWWPKLQSGGVFLGHDYNDRYGVPAAVKERFGDNAEISQGEFACWKVVKK